MKFTTTGKSLKELHEEYGTGSAGFYLQSWYKNELFFTEKPEAGEWEVLFDKKTTGKTYTEQIRCLEEGMKPLHPAIIAEMVLSHYKKTGERLLEDWWVRSSALDSGGSRVIVGFFDSVGLGVDSYWGDGRSDDIGLSAARNLDSRPLESSETFESTTLESAIKVVREAGYVIYKEITEKGV